MRRTGLLLSCFIAACSPAAPAATASPAAAPDSPKQECRAIDTSTPPKITRFEAGGLTVHTFVAPAISASTATHIIESEEGLIVVDTQMLRDYARRFREYADGLGKPITHVIISHGHPDHYFGLEFFEDRPTYALPQTRKDMEQRHRFHLKIHRETEQECDAVTDRVRFVDHDLATGAQVLDGVSIEIDHQRSAEDDDQAVLLLPAAQTLILQDLMATDAHGFTSAGMIDGWIERLRVYAAKTEYTHVLAGHGSPTDLAGIGTMIDYLEQSQHILDTAQTSREFIEAMQSTFPDRPGTYIVELMAMMKFPPEAPKDHP